MNRSILEPFQIKQEIKEEPEEIFNNYEEPVQRSPTKVVTKIRIFPMVNLSSNLYKKDVKLDDKFPSMASSSKHVFDEEYEAVVDLRYNKRTSGQLLRVCRACGEKRKHEGRGLCSTCYQREVIYPRMKGGILLDKNEKSRQKKCLACGKMRILKARQMCMKCYNRVIVNPDYRKENGMGPLKRYQPVSLKGISDIKSEEDSSFSDEKPSTSDLFIEKLAQFRLNERLRHDLGSEGVKEEPLSDEE